MTPDQPREKRYIVNLWPAIVWLWKKFKKYKKKDD